MTSSSEIIFQTDSEIVKQQYKTAKNYLIEYTTDDTSAKENYCTIYFSSNNLYFPNNNSTFQEEIIKKNTFEWYSTRINKAKKHIFIRDIHKQWYLTGINEEINTIEKLHVFLKKETKDYKTITIGSSSGGYAAVLFGQLLNAYTTYSFNGQFRLFWQMQNSSSQIDPILFRFKKNDNLKKYYNIVNFIKNPSSILYFNSQKSSEDIAQMKYVKNLGLQFFIFKTKHHGIPFIASTLPKLLNTNVAELLKLKNTIHNPFLFSLKIGGFKTTVKGIKKIKNKFHEKIPN
ncbi:hypothetical protein [uncultured Maribacter sp.]|uniref:hypothetical protein n=1 Tax=uncultured Maribacter sp. TaxID=431308 RepID=UPI002619F51A|nr:hypothetical protein [uncultured Maribacter sp.]